MPSVYARTGGQWKPLPGSTAIPDLLYGRYLGTWRPVKSAHIYKKDAVTGAYRWHTIFQRIQYPPQSVRGTAVNGMTGATLSWAAPVGTTAAVPLEYQVRQYLAGSPTVFYPWTRNLSQSFTGLLTGKTYEYEVTVRAVSGLQLEETSEPRVKLLTGVPAVHRTNGSAPRTVYIVPMSTDTWSADAKWGEASGGVRQGYASDKTRNAHGVIRFNSSTDSLYTNTVAALKAAGVAEPDRAAADATVLRARISHVFRVDTDKAAAAPAIYCFPCLINTGSNVSPQPAGARATFTAPAPGKSKDDVRIIDLNEAGAEDNQDRLKLWAQAWLNKTNVHNGILIEREDGAGNNTVGFNGWCAFRGHTYTADWRLEMDLTWDFYYPAATNARWL